MDNMACNKGQHVRKTKKKQVKDELDRLKQAEKKKRRLEKALATSAAIISELEKKKQKKKEEQQRLDEESAAIAEAVALHVLHDEVSDDSSRVRDEGRCKNLNCNSNLGVFPGRKRVSFPHQDGGVCHLKQAEKKKRRLEKALATSAAIISELEKKKQKKKEEQQRLDEEGAAIAEAVALHVLHDEDSDDSCRVREEAQCKLGNCNNNFGFFPSRKRASFPHQDGDMWSVESMGWASDAYNWDGTKNAKWSFSLGPLDKNLYEPMNDDEFSADLIAVSSLHIAEDVVAGEGQILF